MTKQQDTQGAGTTQPTPGGHTAGPWRVAEDNNPFADGRHVFAKGFDGSDFVVANLKTDHTFVTATSREQQQINARLIAAAPDLLEAAREGLICADADVESARQDCIEHGEDPDADQFVKVFTERRDLMLAAIAKATGQ